MWRTGNLKIPRAKVVKNDVIGNICGGGTCYSKLVTTSYVTPLINQCGTWPLGQDIRRAIEMGEMRINEDVRFNIDAQLSDYVHLTAVDDGKLTANDVLDQFPMSRIGGIIDFRQRVLIYLFMLLIAIGFVTGNNCVTDETSDCTSSAILVTSTIDEPTKTIDSVSTNKEVTITVTVTSDFKERKQASDSVSTNKEVTTTVTVTSDIKERKQANDSVSTNIESTIISELKERKEVGDREKYLLQNIGEPTYQAAKYVNSKDTEEKTEKTEKRDDKPLLAVNVLGVQLKVANFLSYDSYSIFKRDCKKKCKEKTIITQNSLSKEEWDELKKKKRCCDSVHYVPDDDEDDEDAWFESVDESDNDVSIFEGLKRFTGNDEKGKFRGREANINDDGYHYLRFFEPDIRYRIARKLGANPYCDDILEFRVANNFKTNKVKFFVKAGVYKHRLLYRENFPAISIDEICLRYGNTRVD